MRVLIFALILSGCGSLNTVEICSGVHCATGYFDESGHAVTVAHGFADGAGADVRAAGGYSAHGQIRFDGPDTAEIDAVTTAPQKMCRTSVRAGDWVTVSTLYGPVRARVASTAPNGFIVRATLRHGDSGAPVTRRGCLAGFVHGLAPGGGSVILTRGN
jgi:hypothetical protein